MRSCRRFTPVDPRLWGSQVRAGATFTIEQSPVEAKLGPLAEWVGSRTHMAAGGHRHNILRYIVFNYLLSRQKLFCNRFLGVWNRRNGDRAWGVAELKGAEFLEDVSE